jgi:hypothetical protein
MAGKKSPWDMGEYMPSINDTKAYHWCIKNGIFISPTAKTEGAWWLDIENQGNINRSPKTFTKTAIWEKMYEYYNYYYDKYKK